MTVASPFKCINFPQVYDNRQRSCSEKEKKIYEMMYAHNVHVLC